MPQMDKHTILLLQLSCRKFIIFCLNVDETEEFNKLHVPMLGIFSHLALRVTFKSLDFLHQQPEAIEDVIFYTEEVSVHFQEC